MCEGALLWQPGREQWHTVAICSQPVQGRRNGSPTTTACHHCRVVEDNAPSHTKSSTISVMRSVSAVFRIPPHPPPVYRRDSHRDQERNLGGDGSPRGDARVQRHASNGGDSDNVSTNGAKTGAENLVLLEALVHRLSRRGIEKLNAR